MESAPFQAAMPPGEKTDRYLAEVDRLLGLRGRERKRALAIVRRRLSALRAEETKQGASAVEAEKKARARMGEPEQVAAELRERALTHKARNEAQSVLAAFIPITLALLAIALEVFGLRRFRYNGTIDINAGSFGTTWDGFFHYHPALGVSLPPLYLSLKLVLAAAFVLLALVLAETATAFTRRRRLSAGLTLAAGSALVVAVALQIALAFEWHRLRQGHSAWLVVAMAIEVATVLILAAFLARPARALLRGRLQPLASALMFVFLALVLLGAVSARSGFSATNLCGPGPSCGPDPEEVLAYTSNQVVDLELPDGPAAAPAAVALQGRRLAAVTEGWKNPTSGQSSKHGQAGIDVWEVHWSRAQRGPCGAVAPGVIQEGLSRRTSPACQIWFASNPGGVVWKRVARLEGARASALAASYLPGGRLVVAYSRMGGIWLVSAPAWNPRRVLAGRAGSLRLVALRGGDLALAATVHRAGRPELELIRSHGDRWSQPVAVEAQPGPKLVAGAAQLALLYRDRGGRLMLERRAESNLSLLERRSFGTAARGALGNLRGDALGLAVATPLPGKELRLRTFRIEPEGLVPVTSETFNPRSRLGLRFDTEPASLTGVIQTGSVVRALYGGFPRGHVSVHVAMTLWLRRKNAVFVSDWPRWAAIVRSPELMKSYEQPPTRWTSFDLVLGQPPERQLQSER